MAGTQRKMGRWEETLVIGIAQDDFFRQDAEKSSALLRNTTFLFAKFMPFGRASTLGGPKMPDTMLLLPSY